MVPVLIVTGSNTVDIAVKAMKKGAREFVIKPFDVDDLLTLVERTLEELGTEAAKRGITTLRPVPVRRDRLEIPEAADLLFVSATYHHLPDPARYFADARSQLRPGARVVILESRKEGLLARFLAPHATHPRTVEREMTETGYRLVATHDVVRGYWFGEFIVDTR